MSKPLREKKGDDEENQDQDDQDNPHVMVRGDRVRQRGRCHHDTILPPPRANSHESPKKASVTDTKTRSMVHLRVPSLYRAGAGGVHGKEAAGRQKPCERQETGLVALRDAMDG